MFARVVAGNLPRACDIPTGLGKTSALAIWLIARGLADNGVRGRIPRRLVYVVDGASSSIRRPRRPRRFWPGLATSPDLAANLGLTKRVLHISTLRGQHVDNRDWLIDPSAPTIVVGTVDMVGSRLLFSGYGVSPKMRAFHAGLFGQDTLIVHDEAHLSPVSAS